MGIDLDMTRGYSFNRSHTDRMLAKRQFMRQLYLDNLGSRDYYFYTDSIPREVTEDVKKDIRKKYRIMRMELWMKTFGGFILLLGLFLLIMHLLSIAP